MDNKIASVAVDFGASSGRVIMGTFDGEKIELEELYRFPNEPVRIGGKFCWDFFRLFHEMKKGLKIAASKGIKICSIGIDTWGVDYGLLDVNDNLIGNPVHYRDNRTDGILQEIEKEISFEELYEKTGIQNMSFNTLYQLYSERKYRPVIIKNAKTMLFMPDLFAFYLTGEKHNEYTISSTSQLLNSKEKNWDKEIFERLNLPMDILQNPIKPGSIYGYLKKEISEEIGLWNVPVVAVGCHDTASAVAGTPLKDEDSAYLSCGTWSLLGIELTEPIINKNSLNGEFTNEGGVGGKIRFLKNINGLWVIQQLKSSWSKNVKEVSFPDIIREAKNAKNKSFCIDPTDEAFLAPLNMADAIVDFCERNEQGTPKGLGEIAIAAYNGLAKKYKETIEELENIIERKINTINMVGGGIQDEFLCQLTANSTGKHIITGPIEASVLGNIMVQFTAFGKIKDITEGRKLIRNSIIQKEYDPA